MKAATVVILIALAVSPALLTTAPPPATDAIAEVNRTRAAKGLKPFARDPGLSSAAKAAASYRAERLMAGHTSDDFSFLPEGWTAKAAGCAAWRPEDGWGACATYDDYKSAGAAWAMGQDGRRYMHLFVK